MDPFCRAVEVNTKLWHGYERQFDPVNLSLALQRRLLKGRRPRWGRIIISIDAVSAVKFDEAILTAGLTLREMRGKAALCIA